MAAITSFVIESLKAAWRPEPNQGVNMLEVKDLHVTVEGKEILKGLSLTINLVRCMPSWAPTEPASRPCRR